MEQKQIEQGIDVGLSRFFGKVYGYLGLGIAISAVTAYLVRVIFFEEIMRVLRNFPFGLLLLWVVEIGLVIYLSAKAKSNPSLALGGFALYSMLNGITLGVTIAMYTSASIYSAFIAASATYGAMAIFGTRTKKSLSGWGQALRGGLMGIIIVMLLNGFILKSSLVDLFISFATVIVFAGLTAYDHQNIKRIYYEVGESEEGKGMAVFCALQLYLDFINLLLAFLRIFGKN